ncbi:MAG: phage major capsid protein [Promicromonosporaceae bacterium]|nr:phage major capsid protein [Promicromonosporaceae bacterium]
MSEITTKAGEEKRPLTEAERGSLDKQEKRAKEIDDELEVLETRSTANQRYMEIAGRLSQQEEKEERSAAQRRGEPPIETRSFGQQFAESEQVKEYSGRGNGHAVEFQGFIEHRAAISGAITTATGSGASWFSSLTQPQRVEFTDPIAPTPFLDAIGREQVSLGAIEYVRWDMRGPEAGGPIPETDLKPQANLAPPEIVPVSLKTYAHWVPISRQALEDLPRIQSIVETQLRDGLRRKLQSVALAAFAAATIPAADGTGLTGIRQAVGQLEALGIPAPSLVLNPIDYANLDVEAADASNSGPTQFGRIWGLNTIPAPLPQGTAYVGDLRDAVTWFDRNQYSVYLTDSHADYFIRNTLVILAEARAEFVVTHPEALLAVELPEPTEPETTAAATSSK